MAEQPIDTPETVLWLPDGCPDWCVNGGLHVDRDDYEDRIHDSASVILPLLADNERPLHTDNPELHIHLQQHYREIGPRVCISRNGTPGTFLTPAEAERLAIELLKIAAIARGDAEQDDVKAAFYAGYHGGQQGGDVTAHWRRYSAWTAAQ